MPSPFSFMKKITFEEALEYYKDACDREYPFLAVFTTEWCGNCKGLYERLQEVYKKYWPHDKDFEWGYYVDITDHTKQAKEVFDLRSVPSMVIKEPVLAPMIHVGPMEILKAYDADVEAYAKKCDENYEKGGN